MADDNYELSEIEELQQRLHITTKFAVRLAYKLVFEQVLARPDVAKMILGLTRADTSGLPAKAKALSHAEGRQAALIHLEFHSS